MRRCRNFSSYTIAPDLANPRTQRKRFRMRQRRTLLGAGRILRRHHRRHCRRRRHGRRRARQLWAHVKGLSTSAAESHAGFNRRSALDTELAHVGLQRSRSGKYPPAEPEALRLRAPQRGLFAIVEDYAPAGRVNQDGRSAQLIESILCARRYCAKQPSHCAPISGTVKLLLPPRQSRGASRGRLVQHLPTNADDDVLALLRAQRYLLPPV